MTRIVLLALCLAFAGVAAKAENHSQLAQSLGLSAQQAAQLSPMQLVLLKHVRDNPNFSEGEKRRRSRAILAGVVPRVQLRF